MAQLVDRYKISEKRYDSATKLVRDELGSYEKIAHAIHSETGEDISAGTIRNWFLHRRIPVEYAALFSDLTDGCVSVIDFFPWIEEYV